ncbi:MAG: Rha family transcriptional regulator [Delftia acidovorans]|jgi:Rha family phage regulatory protein|nr:Rha family transcriptional regulator [Delftia acidovorans]
MNAIQDLTAFISREHGGLVTDSRAVALAFGKLHKNVLRTIDQMRLSTHPEIAKHYRLNFEPVDFIDKNGDRRPMYRMTQKGLSELAMSFTGDKARVVRIRFINAFDEVAERLSRAERSITERLFDLERRELPSQIKGQVGSKLMNERRKEKPVFAEERAVLEALAQPRLPWVH